jgi:hypothetical protein
MTEYTPEELSESKRAIMSLRNKSAKASEKLKEGSWQHRKMASVAEAADIALSLIDGNSIAEHQSLANAHDSLADALERAEAVVDKFPKGTAQHTLQTRRIAALKIGISFIEKERGG